MDTVPVWLVQGLQQLNRADLAVDLSQVKTVDSAAVGMPHHGALCDADHSAAVGRQSARCSGLHVRCGRLASREVI